MTRMQFQLPDALFARVRRSAEVRESSLAEVCRNARELYVNVHAVEGVAEDPVGWKPPVCRSTGRGADPFADEDWREHVFGVPSGEEFC